jgi:hypothetical protein
MKKNCDLSFRPKPIWTFWPKLCCVGPEDVNRLKVGSAEEENSEKVKSPPKTKTKKQQM